MILCLAACAPPRPAAQSAAAAPAASALGKGDLGAAKRHADDALARDAKNPKAALVRALTRYERVMKQLSRDLRTVAVGGAVAGGVNQRYLTSALEQADVELGAVEDDLALASRDPDIALDLCLACWEKDWNGNGRVDSQDRLLFQVELDALGRPIAEDDPRRKPTFRFDHGDVYWARAFVSFQRAAIDVALAYDFSDVNRLLEERANRPRTLRLKLVHPERMRSARARLLTGLGHSDASRRAYLREQDDEREWLPNPRQRNHPLPMPVDAALYATWEGVVGDLERLVKGEEGLGVRDLAELGDHRWKNPPGGYVDVGSLFSAPRDIVIDLDALEHFERKHDVEGLLKSALGTHYVKRMRPSPLPRRLDRMKAEVDRGEESLDRKLRYLFWIN